MVINDDMYRTNIDIVLSNLYRKYPNPDIKWYTRIYELRCIEIDTVYNILMSALDDVENNPIFRVEDFIMLKELERKEYNPDSRRFEEVTYSIEAAKWLKESLEKLQ